MLNFNSDGTFDYTPNAGFVGGDSFTYQISDGLETVQGTATIDVTNDVPELTADEYTVHHDTALSISLDDGVLANDTDADGDSFTASLNSGPTNGSLSFNADGSFTYTPNSGFLGTDQFSYLASDPYGSSTTATVAIEVTNEAPIGNADEYVAWHDDPLNVTATEGALANDVDELGETLVATLVSGPTSGSLNLGSDGDFVYTPNAGFLGEDSFTYTVSDGFATSDPVTVTLEVSNTPPIARDDEYDILHDQILTVAAEEGVLADDDLDPGETAAITLVGDVTQGTLSLNADGGFVYTPNAGYVGEDSFTYRINDGIQDSEIATVTLYVDNTLLDAVDDAYVLSSNGSLTVSAAEGILANDSDDPGDFVDPAVSIVQDVAHGTLSLASDGSFTYTPNAGFVGADRFRYELSDGIENSRMAWVDFTVTDQVVLAQGLSYRLVHDQTFTVDATEGLLTNDWSDTGSPLTASLDTGPDHGTVTVNSDGSFSYSPDAGYLGNDSFTYIASDGTNQSAAVAVQLSVFNTTPVALEDSYRVVRGGMLSLAEHFWPTTRTTRGKPKPSFSSTRSLRER